MKHHIKASWPARLGLLLGLGLATACTGEFWASDSATEVASSKPTRLTPPPAPATKDQVAQAQTLLRDLGFDPGPIDGLPGKRTAAAVKAYQEAAGMETDGVVSAPLIERLEAEVRSAEVTKAQQQLSALGYDPGPADGRLGPKTEAAIMAFQVASGRPRDGRITPELLAALEDARPAVDEPVTETAEAPESAEPQSAETETAEAAESAEAMATAAAAASAEAAAERATAEAEAAATDAAEPVLAANEQVAAATPGEGALVPGDRVLIGYLGTKDDPIELQVGDDGRLALPEAGSVQAAGLALPELRDRVTVKLIESYMGSVDVKVGLAGAAGDGSEVVAAGDRLVVSLNGGQAAAREVEVAADGRLALPDAGAVQAAGLDLAELEEEISVKLLESYMDKLDVSIERAE